MNKATEAALWAMDDWFQLNPDPQQPLHRARLRGIIKAYGIKWEADSANYEVIEVEKLLMAPIKSLDTGKDSGFTASGKIDVILREKRGGKSMLIMDHKSASSAHSPEKDEHLMISSQPSQYAYLCWANGLKPTHLLWDRVLKSLHRKGKNETYDELEYRIQDIYMGDPSKFTRSKIPIIKDQVARHVSDLYDYAKEIDLESKGNNHLRSTGNCFSFNTPCMYLSCCTGFSDPDDTSVWKRTGPRHQELELSSDIDQFKILTNSRLNCYQGCRQNHAYRYNEGLVKINQENNENLFIGSAFHSAMQAYWEVLRDEKN
jgi:hypothetical protein